MCLPTQRAHTQVRPYNQFPLQARETDFMGFVSLT